MKIVILGAGEQGKLALNLLKQEKKKVAGFLDDNKNLAGRSIEGVKVLGGTDNLKAVKADSFVIGIGSSSMGARKKLFETAINAGLKPYSLVHKTAFIDKTVKQGNGLTIFPNVTVNMGAEIGNDVIIYSGSVVEHESIIGDHCYISPGVNLAGNVKVGEGTFIGIGANVIQHINIGRNVIIGAGAVVLEDVPDNAVIAGVPAKILRYQK